MRSHTTVLKDQPFTNYLQGLARERTSIASGQTEEMLKLLWMSLKDAIRRRGLWERPPSYLGVYGVPSWSQAEQGVPYINAASGDAQELLMSCYKYIFVDRYPYLARQLRLRPNVDGLIYRNVRNFVHDTQKKYDPLGFRVFDQVRAALGESVEEGELFVLTSRVEKTDTKKLGGNTVFSCEEKKPDESRHCLDSKHRLAEIVPTWNDTLLPDLITARGGVCTMVVATLRMLIRTLPSHGVETFRFQDLVEPLKSDARHRWGALYDHAEGPKAIEDNDVELLKLVRSIAPDTLFETRNDYRKLSECIDGAVERLSETAAVRRHLIKLWNFLRRYAAPEGADGDDLPSRRQLAIALGIPRNLMPRLFSLLGKLTANCHGNLSRSPTAEGGEPDLPRERWDPETVAAWIDHWAVEARRRADSEEQAAESEEPRVSNSRWHRWPSRRMLALAATLLLAVSLGLLVALERQRYQDPGSGRGSDAVIVNPPMVLLISNQVRGSSEEVEISPEDPWLQLLFSAPDADAGYRLKILDENDREVWSAAIAWDRLRGFTVLVPTSQLSSGEYTLRLYILRDDGTPEFASEHTLTVKEIA